MDSFESLNEIKDRELLMKNLQKWCLMQFRPKKLHWNVCFCFGWLNLAGFIWIWTGCSHYLPLKWPLILLVSCPLGRWRGLPAYVLVLGLWQRLRVKFSQRMNRLINKSPQSLEQDQHKPSSNTNWRHSPRALCDRWFYSVTRVFTGNTKTPPVDL